MLFRFFFLWFLHLLSLTIVSFAHRCVYDKLVMTLVYQTLYLFINKKCTADVLFDIFTSYTKKHVL